MKDDQAIEQGVFVGDEILIAIVGGGVVGCAVAWELSGRYNDIFVIEKNAGITQGENQSSRNSGVIHSGIYYDEETRPQKASLCVEGNRLIYDFCKTYRVPALKTGKLIVATTREEEDSLGVYLERGIKNRVPGIKEVAGSKVKDVEPNVRGKSGLLIPSAGIVEPTSLVYRLHTLASQKGVQFMTGTEVIGVEGNGDFMRLHVRYRDGQTGRVKAKAMINSAGIEADLVARFINPRSPYELDPVRGESYKFYGHKRPELGLSGMNVYPAPGYVTTPYGRHFTVGVHLTPTFASYSFPGTLGSTVTIGPRLVSVADRDGLSGPPAPPEVFVEKVRPFFPGLREEDLIWHQSGGQARLKGHRDFVIMTDSGMENFINLLGIDSPGLTSCLAIARKVKATVEGLGL